MFQIYLFTRSNFLFHCIVLYLYNISPAYIQMKVFEEFHINILMSYSRFDEHYTK